MTSMREYQYVKLYAIRASRCNKSMCNYRYHCFAFIRQSKLLGRDICAVG
jgi:hypothetical protein